MLITLTGIRTLWLSCFREKSKLQVEVAARRQKRHLMRQARHKYLEDAALHEAELLQELDRFDKLLNLASCNSVYNNQEVF